MSCVLRRICRILLGQATKESLEYIEEVWLAEEEKPSADGGGRHSEGNVWGEAGGPSCPTYLSVTLVRRTNALILSAIAHEVAMLHVSAMVKLLKTEEGGRTSCMCSGYRNRGVSLGNSML